MQGDLVSRSRFVAELGKNPLPREIVPDSIACRVEVTQSLINLKSKE